MSETEAPVEEEASKIEFRKISTKDEAVAHDIEISVDSDWYKVWFAHELNYQLRLVRVPAFVLNDKREVYVKDNRPVPKLPFDAALEAWGMVGPDEWTILFVQLGAATVLSVKDFDKELLRCSERQGS